MSRIMEDVSAWPLEKRESYLKKVFEEKMGRTLNLEEPKSFSEMIQWIKLYYRDPLMGQCVDKVLFKEYVGKQLKNIRGGVQPRYMKYGRRLRR